MKQLSRFALVGAINTVWGYSLIFSCMYFFALSGELSNAIGYIAAIVSSYFLHRKYTFRSSNHKQLEFIMFVVIFLVAYSANLFAFSFLVRVMGFNPYVTQVLAGLVYVSVSYVLNKLVVFRPRPQTR